MRRRIAALVVLLALGLALAGLATPGVAEAQAAEKRVRVGWLGSGYDVAPFGFEQFREGLRGYGFTAAFEVRYAYGQVERLPGLAAELVGHGVEILLVRDSPAAHAARRATTTVPIILVGAGDPVEQGLAESLARPGGNVTGLSYGFGGGIVCKWLQLLREIDATLARVAFVWNSAEPTAAARVRELRGCADPLGIAVHAVDVRTAEPDLAHALTVLSAKEIGGVIVDPFVEITGPDVRYKIRAFAETHRLPDVRANLEVVTLDPDLLKYGPPPRLDPELLKYGPPPGLDHFRQAGRYAGKILTGADPATLPIEQPMAFRLEVNLRTAKRRGLSIPESILVWADRVIE